MLDVDRSVGLAPDEQIEVFRIVQEGLGNARRHAGAKHVEVEISQQNGRRVVLVRDDGVGFDEETAESGQGLENMKLRADAIQGELSLNSTPGRGTLSAVYTLASNSAAAVAALGTGRFLDFAPGDLASGGTGVSPVGPREGNGLPWWLATLLLVSGLLVAAGAAVPLTKHARRVRRLRRRDPRALAAGVRAELVAVLADRGAQVGRDVTLAELERVTQRVLSLSAGPLLVALGEARFGPAGRAGRAASTARRELGRLLATARSRERLADRARAALSVRSFQAR